MAKNNVDQVGFHMGFLSGWRYRAFQNENKWKPYEVFPDVKQKNNATSDGKSHRRLNKWGASSDGLWSLTT